MKLLYTLLFCSFIALQACGPTASADHACTEKCSEGTHTCGDHCGCGDACECSEGKTCSDKCELD